MYLPSITFYNVGCTNTQAPTQHQPMHRLLTWHLTVTETAYLCLHEAFPYPPHDSSCGRPHIPSPWPVKRAVHEACKGGDSGHKSLADVATEFLFNKYYAILYIYLELCLIIPLRQVLLLIFLGAACRGYHVISLIQPLNCFSYDKKALQHSSLKEICVYSSREE